jgi:flagellar motor component MotA
LLVGKILFLVIFAAVIVRSYFMTSRASFVDPYGFLFVLAGGMALTMISFPGAEILRALRHAAGASGNDAEIRSSVHFWEAAGRGFWILGVLRSVLNLIIGFTSLAIEQNGLQLIMNKMAHSLLAVFYGLLLAVICLIPCWKLKEKLQGRPGMPNLERGDRPTDSFGLRFGTIIGYVIFLSVIFPTIFNFSVPAYMWWPSYRPSLLIVLGGAIAIMLFTGKTNSGPTVSTALSGMGFVGVLMGCIQMMFGIASFSGTGGPEGVAEVAGALMLILSSCMTALLAMVLLGAPLEDHAIRTGSVPAPSGFSRISWYVFPLLATIFQVLAFIMIITPMSKPQ